MTVRINIRSVANTKKAKKEKRNGRDVIIVPSATLPDDVVMNNIKYPAKEIEKSFTGLEQTPAPLGHPTINGKFVSARSPEGINLGWIGAWNENVRRENGRVYLDKVIDVEVAGRTEDGKRLLNAIDEGKPIHTSTGLYCNLTSVSGAVDYNQEATDLNFDHDAILLDEVGAATPEQGVGMFVNSKGETEEVKVINSAIEAADRDLDWALEYAAQALEKRKRAPLLERIKAVLIEAFASDQTETSTKQNEEKMSKEELDKLSGKVDALTESLGKIGETVANAISGAIKPLVDAQAAAANEQKARDETERTGLIEKIVAANVLDADTAKELTLNAARKLAENLKVEKPNATALNSAFRQPGADSKISDAFVAPKGAAK